MTLNIKDRLSGFTVQNARKSDELNAVVYEFIHDKCKTPVVWVDNGEINKLFSITFKTLPSDDTGVFHILEHSVLNGSEKYPVREPFVELIKSSMNTFLNAMTFPDKTMYPVSSRNEQDFLNLTSVYLDAVFAPRILTNPNIFYQEGWHIEKADENYLYKGVVFNEMKGAMAGAERAIEQKLLKMLFPASIYGFNSGGDPEAIPDLSYEQFTNAYKRFYHPSNARVFLDGSVPIEKTLAMLNDYLKNFEESKNLPEITMQNPVSGSEVYRYEIAKNEDKTDKGYYTLGKIVGSWKNPVMNLAAYIVLDVLMGSNAAPVKRMILEKGLAKDLSFSIEDSIAQPYMMVSFTHIKDGKQDEILSLFTEKCREIIASGFEKDQLLSSINRLAFRLREPNEPTGIYRAINALTGWLHGGDPISYMTSKDAIASLISMAESGEYEKLAEDMLLNREGMCTLLTLPSKTLGDEKVQAENERLLNITGKWTQTEIEENLRLNEGLALFQKTPDLAEDLKKLPVLSISEVSDQPEFNRITESKEYGVSVLRNDIAVSGIKHISMYFNISDLRYEDIPLVNLFSGMLGKLSTGAHEAALLQSLIKTYIGRMDFSVESYSRNGSTKQSTLYFVARMSALSEYFDQAADLFTEILTDTRLSEISRIREIVLQKDEALRQMGTTSGHALGVTSALSHYSCDNAVKDAVYGYTYTRAIHSFAKNFESEKENLIILAQKLISELLVKENLILSITDSNDTNVERILSAFGNGNKSTAAASYQSYLPTKMGIRIPSQVGYAVMANHLSAIGSEYHAGMRVAETILSFSHLWNAIRVQGGAYGTGFSISRYGNMFAYSYRDPSPIRSLNVYAEMAAFLREFCESDEEIDKYIISTIASKEPLTSPRDKAQIAETTYLTGVTYEDIKKSRMEMLHTTKANLLSFADVMERFYKTAAVCIVAGDNALQEEKSLEVFDV